MGDGGIHINKWLADKILREWLFEKYDIATKTDQNLFQILSAAAKGDKWALKYLKNSTEVQELLGVLNWIEDSYTIENFDLIWLYLKNNPEYNKEFHISFDDFYVETFDQMIYHLSSDILQLQSIDDIIYFVECIKDKRTKLEKMLFPDKHNELTFVVKLSFDIEYGSIIHQVFIWKTEYVDIENMDLSKYDENEDDDIDSDDDELLDYEQDFNPRQELFNMDQFISIWKKHTYDKHLSLVILKNMSYGRSIFDMFALDYDEVKSYVW